MSTQPERVSVEQLLQRLQHAEDAYGERLAAETEQLRAENEKLRAAMRLIRDAGLGQGTYFADWAVDLIDRAALDEEQTTVTKLDEQPGASGEEDNAVQGRWVGGLPGHAEPMPATTTATPASPGCSSTKEQA